MIRIAMWSGPRNISTAMMRAFENRADTLVVDEPLYAHYLRTTGAPHPGSDEVLAAQENDWRKVVDALTHDAPGPCAIYYQKHMAHHVCGDMDLDWLAGLRHAFLLREPKAMLTSLAKVLPRVTLADTGMAQQRDIYRRVLDAGGAPPVIDSADVLRDPRRALTMLCEALGIGFDEAMLRWPAGPRESDGIWAPHWYAQVTRSTGFKPYTPRDEPLPDGLEAVLANCEAIYAELSANRIRL